MYHVTTVKGYRVDLDDDMDGCGQTTGCWITKGHYSASLACAQSTGELTHSSTGATITIPQSDVDAVEAWANENGYSGPVQSTSTVGGSNEIQDPQVA